MSDLLDAAAAALDTPADLVQRSAAARAEANGTSIDDVLGAWAGGAPVAAAPPPPADPVPDEAAAPEPEPVVAAVAVAEPVMATPAPAVEIVEAPEPEEPLEPVPLGRRLRTATRVGAWAGAALGLFGFFLAGAFWTPESAVVPETGPVVMIEPSGVLIGVALVSILFGAIVAGLSRAAAAWSNPGMQLASSKSSTAWIGSVIGLVLGIVAGATLTGGFGTEIVAGEETLVQLPILPILLVMLIGGAALGAVTAAITQVMGTPIAMAEGDEDEAAVVKSRLGGAIRIPVAGVMILLLLVVPFGYTLIQANHLASGGAAIVGMLTAGGILGFAALAGSKPEMKISWGEMAVAIAGIGTVLLIIVAVLFYVGSDETEAGDGTEDHAAVVLIVT